MTNRTGANGNVLRQVVEVNASIREVIRVSSAIRLNAINASLMARRSGARTEGFAVVALELRMFSQRLDEAMLTLGTQVSTLVRSAAAGLKKEREHRLFLAAQRQAPEGLVGAVVERVLRQLRVMQERIAEDWRDLGLRIRRALNACGTGTALSWNAKIEAVHGRELRGTLTQVAESVEETISSISGILGRLDGMIAQQQRSVP